MNKNGKSKNAWKPFVAGIAGVLVIVLLLGFFGVIPMPFSIPGVVDGTWTPGPFAGGGESVTVDKDGVPITYSSGGTDDRGETIGPLTGQCDLSAAVQMKVNAYNKYTSAADTTGSAGYWRMVGDIAWTAFTPGTAFTVTGDKLYEIELYAESTASYGGHYVVYQPCTNLYSFSLPVATIATAATYDVTTWNSDGTVNAVATNNQSIGAGDIKTIKMQFIGDYQNAYGNFFPGGCDNVLVFKINSTVKDMTTSGDCRKLSSVPGQVSQATGYDYFAFSVPAHDSNTQSYTCFFTIDNSNGQDLLDTLEDQMSWTLYDSFLYINADDFSNIYCDVSSEDNTDYGIATEEAASVYLA